MEHRNNLQFLLVEKEQCKMKIDQVVQKSKSIAIREKAQSHNKNKGNLQTNIKKSKVILPVENRNNKLKKKNV